MRRVSDGALAVREYLAHGHGEMRGRVIAQLMGPYSPVTLNQVLCLRRRQEDTECLSDSEHAANDHIDRLLAESGIEAIERIVDRCQRKTTRAMPGRPSDAPPGGSRAWSWP